MRAISLVNREDYEINWTLVATEIPGSSYAATMTIRAGFCDSAEKIGSRIASDLETIARILEEESWQENGPREKE